jgi:DNA-binding MarR family transcriptional regulator
MPPAPPLPQSIGRAERTLGALMDEILADTGVTFHQWVALSLVVGDDEDRIDRDELATRLASTVDIDQQTAEAALAGLADEGLLRAETLSDAGRERYERIRAAIDETTAPLYADLPVGDLAATRRILTTIAERADMLLARAR